MRRKRKVSNCDEPDTIDSRDSHIHISSRKHEKFVTHGNEKKNSTQHDTTVYRTRITLCDLVKKGCHLRKHFRLTWDKDLDFRVVVR